MEGKNSEEGFKKLVKKAEEVESPKIKRIIELSKKLKKKEERKPFKVRYESHT